MLFKLKKESHVHTDAWLIERYRATGDLEFLGKLYQPYMHLVYGVCMKYLKDREAARDATMQVFEKLVTELLRREVENFRPWLYVLAKNHCLMTLRAKKSKNLHRENFLDSTEIFMESEGDLHHNDVTQEATLVALKNCMEQLKASQKECVKLFYLEEKCYQEIAEALEMELNLVKSHIQNGKRNLKICLENHG
ncbi:MAG: sigma-70 family RNA polymerase sigma factor [Cyclobacteriaceae bacterium]|nr:sigma-70 family RNA polymerase sigma factor [Cyclobacteriaceae bacterium]